MRHPDHCQLTFLLYRPHYLSESALIRPTTSRIAPFPIPMTLSNLQLRSSTYCTHFRFECDCHTVSQQFARYRLTESVASSRACNSGPTCCRAVQLQFACCERGLTAAQPLNPPARQPQSSSSSSLPAAAAAAVDEVSAIKGNG